MMATKKLDVYYHNKHVGTLAERSDKLIAFQYSTDWQKNGFSISPISLPVVFLFHILSLSPHPCVKDILKQNAMTE